VGRRSEGQARAKATGMQKYGVVGDAVLLEHVLQLPPNWRVALFVLLFCACTTDRSRGGKGGAVRWWGGRGARGGILPALTLITKALRIMPVEILVPVRFANKAKEGTGGDAALLPPAADATAV
jgi:hypothetical protein